MNDYDAIRQNMRCTIDLTIDDMNRWAADVFMPALATAVRQRRNRYSVVPPHRTIAVIEAEIARAATPALRPEDV